MCWHLGNTIVYVWCICHQHLYTYIYGGKEVQHFAYHATNNKFLLDRWHQSKKQLQYHLNIKLLFREDLDLLDHFWLL